MNVHVTEEAFTSQKRPSNTSKHELKKKKNLLLWVIFALLDLDPDSESGTTDTIESGSGSATLPTGARSSRMRSWAASAISTRTSGISSWM